MNICGYTNTERGRKTSMCLLTEFNYYSDIIRRDLEVISESFIGRYDLNIIRYAYVR